MPHVLVFGATGTIGNAVALSLLRSGQHTVYGIARTPAKAKSLEKQEIIPILGSISQPEKFLKLLEDHPEVSVVVDAAAAYGESATLVKLLIDAGKQRLSAWEKAGAPSGPKLGYIYVSGMWVHGDSHDTVSDIDAFAGTSAARSPPVNMVAWRPEIERMILAPSTRTVLDTAVARPACTYGGGSGIWSGPLSQALKAARSNPQPKTVEISLHAHAVAPLIHVDDVATGVQVLIEKLPLLANTGVYPVFDFVGHVESLQAIMEEAARVLGYRGLVELVGPAEGDVLSEALGASVIGDSGRAKVLLGWQAQRKGMLHNVSVYVNSWLAGTEGGS